MGVVSFAVEAVSENVFGGRINDGRSSEQGDLSFSASELGGATGTALADSLRACGRVILANYQRRQEASRSSVWTGNTCTPQGQPCGDLTYL
jgi:hypothetical protein